VNIYCSGYSSGLAWCQQHYYLEMLAAQSPRLNSSIKLPYSEKHRQWKVLANLAMVYQHLPSKLYQLAKLSTTIGAGDTCTGILKYFMTLPLHTM